MGTIGEPERVRIADIAVDPLDQQQVVAEVMAALAAGRGGWIVTPNVDHLEKAHRDPRLRELLAAADLSVADGAPLLWVARLQGTPLPERVAGADLLWSLSRAAAEHGRSIYLLGGEPGVPEAAARELQRFAPGLKVAGTSSPPVGFEKNPAELARLREQVTAARPDLVFVGLGFPKQERLIVDLRTAVPDAWLLGCGAAIPFAAGAVRRAPAWMGRWGLEWVFRLLSEPRRLVRRYLREDAPYALRLLARAAATRLRRRPRPAAPERPPTR